MKINGSDLINTSLIKNNRNADSADFSNRNTGAVELEKAKRLTTNVKNISQMNDYEINNMPVSEKVVIEAIQKANKAISGGDRRFEFSIHEKTNEIVVKVFDSETNELIREIPNEKVLDMVARICEMAGILVDERR